MATVVNDSSYPLGAPAARTVLRAEPQARADAAQPARAGRAPRPRARVVDAEGFWAAVVSGLTGGVTAASQRRRR